MTEHPVPYKASGAAAATVRERLLAPGQAFSGSELKVVRALLANYPAAGLTTVSRLAKSAGVSDPTVLRLAVRLGYQGFADLQEALLAEVQAHMRSPLTLAEAPAGSDGPAGNVYQDFVTATAVLVEAVGRETATADFERAAALIADPRHRVLCLGGRFSRYLAGILQRCLHHMREGTLLLDGPASDVTDMLAEVGRRHVLVVFDYRRYQADVVAFARRAQRRGATVILFTDGWRSPIAEIAEVVLTAPTETASPFDTLASPLVQLEALVAGIAHRLGADWRARAALLEEARGGAGESAAGHDPGASPDPARRPSPPRRRT